MYQLRTHKIIMVCTLIGCTIRTYAQQFRVFIAEIPNAQLLNEVYFII